VSSPDGLVWVANTSVLLDQIVADFEGGAVAEEIVSRHDQLRLSVVFWVLSFYLKHRKDVEDYLAARRERNINKRPPSAA